MEDLRTTFRFVNGGSQYDGGGGGSLRVPEWETIREGGQRGKGPQGPPASTEKGVSPCENAEASRKRNKLVIPTFLRQNA